MNDQEKIELIEKGIITAWMLTKHPIMMAVSAIGATIWVCIRNY